VIYNISMVKEKGISYWVLAYFAALTYVALLWLIMITWVPFFSEYYSSIPTIVIIIAALISLRVTKILPSEYREAIQRRILRIIDGDFSSEELYLHIVQGYFGILVSMVLYLSALVWTYPTSSHLLPRFLNPNPKNA